MLHSMIIRLIHVHQLETLYICYGVKCQSGVMWGHWGQKVILTQNAIIRKCYTGWPLDSDMCISLRSSTYVIGSSVNLGSIGVTGVKRSFSLKCCNSSMLHSMTIRLIHEHQLETLYLLYEVKCQPGVIWGHRGQKVIFSKNATSATEYMVLSLCNTVYLCCS